MYVAQKTKRQGGGCGERERGRERQGEAGVMRKRIGGGEPKREGWIVRDWAEESVKLQHRGDKSSSLPLHL